MKWEDYIEVFERSLTSDPLLPPYDDESFLEYAIMNQARMKRWMKKDQITSQNRQIVSGINIPMRWILITEPWCGDAAHSVPIIYQLSQVNPLITLEIQLRDGDSEILNYLTNGKKSIPILIVRDHEGKDLFTWGPRPQEAASIFQALAEEGADHDAQVIALQNYYNKNKTLSIQDEICQKLVAL